MEEAGGVLEEDNSPSIGDYARAIYTVQLALLDGISSENKLLAAGSLLSRRDYEDVVTERTIVNLCGHPLCCNPLPSDRKKKGRYRISLKEHRVYDLTQMFLYCSSRCLFQSRGFAETLNADRYTDLDHEKISRVLKLFGEGFSEEKEIELSSTRNLKILEKLDSNGKVDVSAQDWMGPSDAIEGYVPRRELRRPSASHSKKTDEGSKSDFTRSVGKEKQVKTTATNKKHSVRESSVDFTSDVIIGHQLNNLSLTTSPSTNQGDDVPNVKVDQAAGTKGDLKKAPLKSCLKSSKLKSTGSTVTWADVKDEVILYGESNTQPSETTSTEAHMSDLHKDEFDLEHVENGNGGDILVSNDVKNSSRFASAEVCAAALSEAAEAVASGKHEVSDAVSEAGIIIFPPDHSIGGEEGRGVVLPPDNHPTLQKTLRKLDSDVFDPDNSWFDSPPEGFSLELSQFATMWMALFEWITASSLAYIYGREESAMDDFLLVNGKEYPRMVVVSDGLSSEIKKTLDGCLSRYLPSLALRLGLGTPISVMGRALACLLDTMTFRNPLPPFKMAQWHVIILLFLEALSVQRISSLASPLTNRVILIQVLDHAKVSIEEYDLMKDLMIPLGRDPEFRAQSGG